MPDAPLLRCSLCKEEKPATSFYRDNSKVTGRHSRCKVCSYRKTPEQHRRSNLARQYGLTPETYHALCVGQNHRCAICKRKPEKLYVDHKHGTKTVRGLLCHHCNTGLGMFRDRHENLERAIAYLLGRLR